MRSKERGVKDKFSPDAPYSLPFYAPIAQLDRATDYESVGRGFDSLWAHQAKKSENSGARLQIYDTCPF